MSKQQKPPVDTAPAEPRKPASRERITTAMEHYKHEKGKRSLGSKPDDELMAAARRQYAALLEAQAAKGKGGRPKKTASPAAAVDVEDPSAHE